MINEKKKTKQTNKQRRYVAYRPACLVVLWPQILALGKIYHWNKENSVNEKTFHERESTMLSIKEKNWNGGTAKWWNRGTEEQRNGGTEERRNGGAEERRNGGTEERRNGGTEEQRNGGTGKSY